MNHTGETGHTLPVRPEDMQSVIDNFINMKIAVFRKLPEPSSFYFSDLCNMIQRYSPLSAEELDELTILDFLCLADKAFSAGCCNDVNPETGDLTRTDRCQLFCRTFMEMLLRQSHNKAPQALPVRLFLKLPVWSLGSYVLEAPAQDERGYPVLIHSIKSIVRRLNEIYPAAHSEQTIFKLLDNLNNQLHMHWLPALQSISHYHDYIFRTYSDIYTLLIQPFKVAFPAYFKIRKCKACIPLDHNQPNFPGLEYLYEEEDNDDDE